MAVPNMNCRRGVQTYKKKTRTKLINNLVSIWIDDDTGSSDNDGNNNDSNNDNDNGNDKNDSCSLLELDYSSGGICTW